MTDGDPDVLTAAARGDAAALEAALEQGADANARDRWGASALMHAAARGDLAAVELLLARGAGVNRTSDAGNSALMAAAARGHKEVLTRLLDAGADPGHKNKWGISVDDWAGWPPNAAEVRALLHAASE
ncbi:MAG: ankyrin repeat domain-containing protein [Kiloniellaceae bacterium]